MPAAETTRVAPYNGQAFAAARHLLEFLAREGKPELADAVHDDHIDWTRVDESAWSSGERALVEAARRLYVLTPPSDEFDGDLVWALQVCHGDFEQALIDAVLIRVGRAPQGHGAADLVDRIALTQGPPGVGRDAERDEAVAAELGVTPDDVAAWWRVQRAAEHHSAPRGGGERR